MCDGPYVTFLPSGWCCNFGIVCLSVCVSIRLDVGTGADPRGRQEGPWPTHLEQGALNFCAPHLSLGRPIYKMLDQPLYMVIGVDCLYV